MPGLPYYNTGTVSASASSANLAFTGADAPNNIAIGYGILLPDGPSGAWQLHIATSAGAATVAPNVTNALTNAAYVAFQCSGMSVKAIQDLATLLNSSTYSQIAGLTPATDGDGPEYNGAAWVIRSLLQRAEEVFSAHVEWSLAAASTTDVSASNLVGAMGQITGAGATINTFGNLKGFAFLRYAGANTIVNSANVILLGGVNRGTAAGDTQVLFGTGTGLVRELFYWPAVKSPGDIATRSGTETFSNKIFTNNTANSGYGDIFLTSFLAPNCTTSANILTSFGKSTSGGNCFQLMYTHVADGSASNFFAVNYYGVGIILKMTSSAVAPGTDGNISSGAATARWSTVYAATGTINTSDEREKDWRGALTDAEYAAGEEIFGEIGGFQFLDSIAKKGPLGARMHYGARAQRVKAILDAHGLQSLTYALICYDEWPEIPAIPERNAPRMNADGSPELGGDGLQIIDVIPAVAAVPAGNRWGLRYDELAMLLLAVINRRQGAMEARLAALEAA